MLRERSAPSTRSGQGNEAGLTPSASGGRRNHEGTVRPRVSLAGLIRPRARWCEPPGANTDLYLSLFYCQNLNVKPGVKPGVRGVPVSSWNEPLNYNNMASVLSLFHFVSFSSVINHGSSLIFQVKSARVVVRQLHPSFPTREEWRG